MHQVALATKACTVVDRSSLSSEHRKNSRISTEAAEILEQVRFEIERSPERARAAAFRLLMVLTSRAAAGTPGCRGGLAPWQKRKVDCYLRENLRHPIRIDQVAQQVQLSVSHFCRAFKDSFGVTPHTYIIQLRLEMAQQMMLTTQDPLSHIALACGLADQAHLSKLFRRWVGETPHTWRRQRFGLEQGNAELLPLTKQPRDRLSTRGPTFLDHPAPIRKTVIGGNPQQFRQSVTAASILGSCHGS